MENLQARVDKMERSFEKLEDRVLAYTEVRESVSVLRAEFTAFTVDALRRVAELENLHDTDVRGLNRKFVAFSMTVAGSAVAFGITSLAVFGVPGK